MTAATVVDQICQYFGGAYDANTHTYHFPPAALLAAGLSVVRRGVPKRNDWAEYIQGQPAGTMTGVVMLVWIGDDEDARVTLPAIQGRRKVRYVVELACYVWSKTAYAEDVSDFVYAFGDAIKTRIRLDPTLGTGGIEAGNFQVGEGDGRIAVHREQGETTADGTKAYISISFEAHAYDVA